MTKRRMCWHGLWFVMTITARPTQIRPMPWNAAIRGDFRTGEDFETAA